VTRYDDLIGALPRGSWYKASAQILPFRTSPYQFLFSPVAANRNFRVFINDSYRGQVTSGASGQVIVSVTLDQGEQTILIVDVVSGDRFTAYCTIKWGATILAANAATLESIDDYNEAVRLSFSIPTSDSRLVEDVYGASLDQPNDIDWLLPSYRNLMLDLRQAYRIFGSKLRGLRQAVLAFTSATPTRVPRAWRPWWRLGYQLLENGDFQTRARQFTDQRQPDALPDLNDRALSWAHAAYAANDPNVFPGPITDPAEAQQLYFSFEAGWDGGDIVIAGYDSLGQAINETVTTSQAQPLAAAERVATEASYATVTSLMKTAIGGGANTVTTGVYTGRFVKVTAVSSNQQVATVQMTYLQSGGLDYLQWDSAAFQTHNVAIPISGSYLVSSGAGRYAVLEGLAIDPGAGYALGNERFMLAEMDALGRVLIRFDATPITASTARTQMNTFFGMDPRYGAVQATGSITTVDANSIGAGEQFVLDDGVNAAVTFEFNTVDPAPNVWVLLVGGETAAQVAVRIANSINGVGGPPYNDPGPGTNQLRMDAGVDPALTSRVLIVSHFGGTAGNVAITDTVIDAGFAHTGMASGADSPYASAVALDSGTLGSALGLVPSIANLQEGTASQAALWPVGASVEPEVMGLPRYRALLTSAATFLSTSLVSGDTDRIPLATTTVIFASSVADTATSTTPSAQPDSATALEVIFNAAWRGGSIRVDGTDRDGNVISETFEDPNTDDDNLVVESTLDATSVDLGVNITFTDASVIADVEVGQYFRVTSGASIGEGAPVEIVSVDGPSFYDVAPNQLLLNGSGIGANFTTQSWNIRKSVTRKGVQAFSTITAVVNLDPQAAGDNGVCWVAMLNGREHCTPMWLGRGSLRADATSIGTDILLPQTGSDFASILIASGLLTYPADAGGWLWLQDMEVEGGRNNGLHRVSRTIVNLALGTPFVFAQHQEAGVFFGRFATENPFPVGSTWRFYSGGERVYMASNDRGASTLTIYPPGILTPMPIGAAVETDELPFQKLGLDDGIGYAEVDVDLTYLPSSAPVNENVTVVGEDVGDGWTVNNAALDTTAEASGLIGYLVQRFTLLVGDGVGDISVEKNAPAVLDYLGFDIKIDAWVQQHNTASQDFRIDIDFGSGFSNGALQAVAGTLDGTALGGTRDPTFITRTVRVPYNATQCIVRVAHDSSMATEIVRIEKIAVAATRSTGLYLENNTIGLNDDQAYFGEVLYVWSPEALTSIERDTTGLPETTWPDTLANVGTKQGHIDQIANAHGRWSRYDLSEYAVGAPVNLIGAYDEVAWAAGTLTNMSGVIGTPPRTGYLAPDRVSLVDREPLAIVAPSNATLSQPYTAVAPFPATPEDDEALYEITDAYPDGLVVPSSEAITGGVLPWRFLASNVMQIASVAAGDPADEAVYNSLASYELTYRTLIQAETGVLDLGASYADYLWLVDAAVYQRKEPSASSYSREQQLTFAANYRATLLTPSDQDRTSTVVTRDNGLFSETVAPSNWTYVGGSTIQIRSNAFDPNSLYSITYQALEPTYTSPTSVVVEARSATTSVGVASAAYEAFEVDGVVNQDNQYHQLRITVTGVVDVRDIRVYGLGLKGFALFASPPRAPGIVLP